VNSKIIKVAADLPTEQNDSLLSSTVTSTPIRPRVKADLGNLSGQLPATLVINDGTDTPINVLYYNSGTTTPYDPASGHPSGRRQYDPVVIRKEVDSASPTIIQAYNNNGTNTLTFTFYRRRNSIGGSTSPITSGYYSVKFEGARIVGIKQLLPNTLRGSTDAETVALEEIHFVFQTVTWTMGGKSTSDAWSQ
jgi:type VI secretion system secreted protein Hcp